MRTSHHVLALLALLTFLAPVSAKPPRILAEFDIFKDGDVLLLPVQFNGKQYLFVLDTGATNSVYDSSFRAQLGDPIDTARVESSKGYIELSYFRAPQASLGKMSLRTKEPVFCLDLKAFREASGHRIMGIIGLDFLQQHRIRIDFDAGKLTFLDNLDAESGATIPLTKHGYFFAKASVAGEEEEFMIDTGLGGYGSGNLNAEFRERLMNEGKIKKVSTARYVSAAGSGKEQISSVEEFAFGLFRHHQLYFGEGLRNVLGLSYLSRYTVTFDFPKKKLYLKKGKQFDQPDARAQSGLNILRRDGQTVVENVGAGSPAARAGIEPNDILLKLDDLDAEKERLHVLYQQLARAGETVRLQLRRGDKQREFTLKLGE